MLKSESIFADMGDIRSLIVPRIIGQLAISASSGCLTIEYSGNSSRVFIRNGHPCGIIIPGSRSLGLILLENKIIDAAAHSESLMYMTSTGQLQGKVLLDKGYISEENLLHWLREQQRERFRPLLALEEGEYNFDSEAKLPEWTDDIEISPHIEIYSFLKSDNGSRHLESLFSGLGESPLVLRADDSVSLFGFKERELEFVSKLKRPFRLKSNMKQPAKAIIATLSCFDLLKPVS